MLTNAELIKSLDTLDVLYQNSTTPRESVMHSKHALLELCGWVEEAQDEIVRNCAKRINDPALIKLVHEKIDGNSQFHFHNNFIPLLGLVIGLIKFSELESKLLNNGRYYLGCQSNINNLKKPRNTHAHTHFENSRISNSLLFAPSRTKQMAKEIYLGLDELERFLRRSKLSLR